jgi:peptidoglycan hydrolase-like protein with peptidoglycan-binding domain
MTTARVQPFRAGGRGGEARSAKPPDPARLVALMSAHAAGTKTLAADISEFQRTINDAAYLAWSKAIVIRAAYGARHDDRSWFGGDRRGQLHDGGVQFLGIYQYITAFEDVTAQAREFCRLIGTLRTGEYPLADWEEGSGSQSGRRAAWNHVVTTELGFTPGTGYSGMFFARDHGLAPVEWIAAYQGTEPASPHLLWQFTDKFQVPGVGQADCSVYHGPVADLAAHAFGRTPVKPPPALPFPYPAGDYIALPARDPHCHSGFLSADQPHVRAWQGQMTHRGWYVPVTGHFDAASDTACRRFQLEKGLTADGKVGPATWRATWTAVVT